MEDDILGYWVYIPRYAYQVMRWSALGNTPITSPEAFNIAFQHKDDTKYYPVGEDNSNLQDPSSPMDYRTAVASTYSQANCNKLSNELPPWQAANDSCWATHPAFTFGKTELNGIWVAKFETTGTAASPTIKPNLSSLRSQTIGSQFSIVVNMSRNPDGAAGGANFDGPSYYPVSKDAGANKQNLSNHTQSRMARNTDWGAAAYLATSSYGRNSTQVWINNNSSYVTGCAGDSVSDFSVSTCNRYNTTTGVHASTTDNIYGIYDMSGGTAEYTMSNLGAISTSYITTMPQTRYLDIYYVGPFGIKPPTSSSSTGYYYNFDVCTFPTCGGQALYETTAVQRVSTYYQSWNSEYSTFADSSYPWFYRGQGHGATVRAGMFAGNRYDGRADTIFSSRPILSKF
jgi:hypothetical protein